jgi:hypothetical protein
MKRRKQWVTKRQKLWAFSLFLRISESALLSNSIILRRILISLSYLINFAYSLSSIAMLVSALIRSYKYRKLISW